MGQTIARGAAPRANNWRRRANTPAVAGVSLSTMGLDLLNRTDPCREGAAGHVTVAILNSPGSDGYHRRLEQHGASQSTLVNQTAQLVANNHCADCYRGLLTWLRISGCVCWRCCWVRPWALCLPGVARGPTAMARLSRGILSASMASKSCSWSAARKRGSRLQV